MSQNCDLVDACSENNYLKANLDGSDIDVSIYKYLHNDMSDKDCDFCFVVMEDLAKLWNVHSQVASQLESTICELDELKARPSILGACLECPKLKLELDAHSLNVKKLETKLLEKLHVLIISSPCEGCVSLKDKLIHAINENTMLVQDVTYLTSRLERTKLCEKMIEEDLSQVDECLTRSIHKLSLGYERCEDKGEISTKIVPSSTYNDEEETLKGKQIPYLPNPKPSFNPKRAQKQTTNSSMSNLDGVYICMFCGCAGHLVEFCFRHKKIEFFDFSSRSYSRDSPRTSSRALFCFSHGSNYRSYGFGSRENHFEPNCFGYGPRPRRGDRFPCRPDFSAGGSHTHFESRYLGSPCFPRRGSRLNRPNGELQRIVKIPSGRMVKCWIPKIYLTNPSTEPSTPSHPM
jgi:hypothetical protein